MNRLLYFKDNIRPNDDCKLSANIEPYSEIKIFNDATGELIWEPLHNKTVIAGSALTAMKLFDLDRNSLDATPTYDMKLGDIQYGKATVVEAADGTHYPVKEIKDNNGNIIGQIQYEPERKICGFCLGQGGAGLDISDVFEVPYCSWITPDNLVPFRYPLNNTDDVDESIYKGKTNITLSNGQVRNAYYFKTFSNTPKLEQNYISSIGTFSDSIDNNSVYSNIASADMGRSYVECHLKITKEDCREFFIAHKGLENAKINQISLVSAWKKEVKVLKKNLDGNNVEQTQEYFQDIRPFSVLNIPNEILSDMEKSISIIYTLYF